MGNLKKYYINTNFESDNYGVFYVGTEIQDGYVYVYREISKGFSKPFLVPNEDLKEIAYNEYLYLKELETDDAGFALDVTIEEIINGQFLK